MWSSSILTPFLSGKYIDILLKHPIKKNVYIFTMAFLIISIANCVTTYFFGLLAARLKNNIAFDLNYTIIEHVKRLPLSYIKGVNAEYLNQRINLDSNVVTNFVIDNIFTMIINFLSFLISLWLIFKVNSRIALLLLICIPIYILIYIIFKGPLYKRSHILKETQNKFLSKLHEQLSNIKLIKINSWFELLSNELRENYSIVFKAVLNYSKTFILFSSLNSLIARIATILVFFYGGIEFINGKMTIGDFTITSVYFRQLLFSTDYFMNLGKSYQDSFVSYNRLKEILNAKCENNGYVKINELQNIELKNVYFSYNNNQKIISNFNYKFERGKIYCIVGKNGIGKTTFIDLITGLISDYQGEVLYNSINIKDIDLYLVRQKLIGVDDQDATLMNASIYENITYGFNNMNFELIEQWCKVFNIYDKIMDLPEKFLTNLSDKSSNISGGERQKISLIRTFIKSPEVIILDEPTSYLDKNSIKVLEDILKEIKNSKTIILITHELDIIKVADEVINFNDVYG